MHNFIPYGTQNIEDQDIEVVVSTLKSDFLSTGPKVGEFERKFAEYVGSKYAVAVSNGTAALHCAYMVAGIKEGDEVITTPMTFIATSNAVRYCGGIPVYVDIDINTFNIDEDLIESKITNKTKAISVVHFAGQPCNMDKIMEIAKKHNLIVIEDSAHAVGGKYKGNKIGTIGDMTTFSFHPVKHITTGEGGMITTNNEEMYKKLIRVRNHGITREQEDFCNPDDGAWYYEQLDLGYNYRLTDFQSALGIVQLGKMDKNLERRNQIVEMYEQGLKDIKEITLPKVISDRESAWHLYIIRVNKDNGIGRKDLFNKLRADNIGVNVHYVPVYLNPYYRNLGFNKGLCPNAERLYAEMITLPLHPKMTDDDVNYIIEKIKEEVEELKSGK